jgi:hypothetical protein
MHSSRQHIYIAPLFWECIRFGLMWNMTVRALNVDESYSTALYLFWITAPVLGLISGYALLWLRGSGQHGLEATVILMKAYQTIIGAAASVLLFRSIGTHPIFVHGESVMVGFLTLMDIMMLIFLLIIVIKDRES